jgi:6-pyruvoyltetrahydropterin/6-carboxytetrahydropterin synthase
MGLYLSTKTYTHSEGLSCCFRQWRATHSHCSLLHGYAISFKLVFECRDLDSNNWAMDFGGLKPIKGWLHANFDHVMVVAEDDPELATFQSLHDRGLCDLRVLPSTGCEKFAEYVFNYVKQWLRDQALSERVTIRSVECSEHEGNCAIYME